MIRCRPQSGFTLVEILVVLGILGLLIAVLVPALSDSDEQGQIQRARARIAAMKGALETYQRDLGELPPTSLADKGVPTNGVNNGIESLIRCLSTRDRAGNYLDQIKFDHDEELGNTDKDWLSSDFNRSSLPDLQAVELVDPWGTPYVYIAARDYQRPDRIGKVRGPEGKEFTPTPVRNKETNAYHGPTSYQLWSCGPNRINENGDGDDIASWHE